MSSRYSSSGPSPTRARRSSTPSGSRSGRGIHLPSRPMAWVPNSCGCPSCSSTRSVRYATRKAVASSLSAASVSRSRHCRWKTGSWSACWTSSHAALAPSSPAMLFPGQPTSAITCLSQGRFSASTARIASQSFVRRAAWSRPLRRSSSTRSSFIPASFAVTVSWATHNGSRLIALGEHSVRRLMAVTPGVLGDLGLDLLVQVDARHLGEPEQEDGRVRQFLPDINPPLAPGVERLRDLALQQAELKRYVRRVKSLGDLVIPGEHLS